MAHMEELNRQKDSLVKEIRYTESLLGDLEKS